MNGPDLRACNSSGSWVLPQPQLEVETRYCDTQYEQSSAVTLRRSCPSDGDSSVPVANLSSQR